MENHEIEIIRMFGRERQTLDNELTAALMSGDYDRYSELNFKSEEETKLFNSFLKIINQREENSDV